MGKRLRTTNGGKSKFGDFRWVPPRRLWTLDIGPWTLNHEPPSFCMVKRNGIVIMLAQLEAPGAVRPSRLVDPEGSAWDAYIWIDNADALYAEFKSKGVKIARQICDQIYGCRDFDVADCNGYRWFWTTTISFRLRESIH